MAIPDRQQWVKKRDAAGGSSGLVKSVSIGKLIDEYEKALKTSSASTFVAQSLVSNKQLMALQKGLKTYRAGLPKAKTALIAYVDGIIKEIDEMFRRGERLANPIADIRDHTVKAVTVSQTVATGGDRAVYSKMYSVNVRGAGAAWASLLKLEPTLKTLYDAVWEPLSSPDWSGTGKKTGGAATDPAEADRMLKAAAKEVNARATRMIAELKKRQIMR